MEPQPSEREISAFIRSLSTEQSPSSRSSLSCPSQRYSPLSQKEGTTSSHPPPSSSSTPLSLKPLYRLTTVWWYWELKAIAFSLASLLAILIILSKFQSQPLSAWSFYLQPNKVVSLFTTLSKSTTLLSISTCLSQLKWRHFQRAPPPLNHLRFFNEASRGPFGALRLLGSLKIECVVVLLPGLLALITVLSPVVEGRVLRVNGMMNTTERTLRQVDPRSCPERQLYMEICFTEIYTFQTSDSGSEKRNYTVRGMDFAAMVENLQYLANTNSGTGIGTGLYTQDYTDCFIYQIGNYLDTADPQDVLNNIS